jgi:hypothetical protein
MVSRAGLPGLVGPDDTNPVNLQSGLVLGRGPPITPSLQTVGTHCTLGIRPRLGSVWK